MEIVISEAILENMLNHLEKYIHAKPYCLSRADKQSINEAKAKKPTLQLHKKIKAIVIKVLANVNQFNPNIHFITENILTQTTYYKTLTARP
ncbi:hypothetical protein [Sulfuricurvum sp.]|uniref:hypothetical protein n=1 Tax=Sulfuricurvum sp. TaxID=2025608 RepID=UPI002618D340|nr:hypothetical protein [Sulfuricurvum sp.]MDD2267566.1 hypothetical protein [Sulfuricurvum sp.]MDD2783739.1 hypothetical protein [Sulfuricurvum sp.]